MSDLGEMKREFREAWPKKAGKKKAKIFPLRFCFDRLGVIWVCSIQIKGGVKEIKNITRKF